MNLAGASFRIGVDIGGTFTDVSIVDSYGHVHASKSLSLPSDPAAGVINALQHAATQIGTALPAWPQNFPAGAVRPLKANTTEYVCASAVVRPE